MPVKITKNLKSLKSLPKRVKKTWSKEMKTEFGGEVVDQIRQGKSPVRSHTFVKYSPKYATRKGGAKPVDMMVSGDMLKSLDVDITSHNNLKVEFTDEKAHYHNFGKGNLPKRSLLPARKGEKFNTYLTKILNKLLNRAVKKEVKK